eukprot:4182018-Pleurochrysis_carterae.AAC.1
MHWHTARRSAALRWEDYKVEHCRAGLPVYGSLSLFKKIWASHAEISQYYAKHHPKCDRCGELKVLKDRCEFRTDEAGREERKAVHEAEVSMLSHLKTHAR